MGVRHLLVGADHQDLVMSRLMPLIRPQKDRGDDLRPLGRLPYQKGTEPLYGPLKGLYEEQHYHTLVEEESSGELKVRSVMIVRCPLVMSLCVFRREQPLSRGRVPNI